MPSLVTLAFLRKKAKQRADMEGSSFLSDVEWNENINASAKKLYDILTTFFVDYYYKTATITLNATDDTYPLPDDFYKLLGVDQVINGASGEAVSLDPYQFGERNSYVKPTGFSGTVLHLPYIPTMTALTIDSDTFDGINGWEEFIILDAAETALAKEESDTSAVAMKKKEMMELITASGPIRDAGEAERVTDVNAADPYSFSSAQGTLKYRLIGNSIKFVQKYNAGTVS